MQQGKVIKAVGGFFYISYNGKTIASKVRKKLSYNNLEISVGDNVEFFFDQYKKAVIEDVLPRKNELIRPNVANVDVAAIVVASVPQPDFVLVDKIILNCYLQDIRPVLVVNKSDINGQDFFEQISKEYGDAVSQIISVSAEQDLNLDVIKQELKGETTVFCGQSAVGKTSLLNKIAQKIRQQAIFQKKVVVANILHVTIRFLIWVTKRILLIHQVFHCLNLKI